MVSDALALLCSTPLGKIVKFSSHANDIKLRHCCIKFLYMNHIFGHDLLVIFITLIVLVIPFCHVRYDNVYIVNKLFEIQSCTPHILLTFLCMEWSYPSACYTESCWEGEPRSPHIVGSNPWQVIVLGGIREVGGFVRFSILCAPTQINY